MRDMPFQRCKIEDRLGEREIHKSACGLEVEFYDALWV